MNLTTHWILAFALGIGIFHNAQIALVISIGALIPDLDREYFFVAKDFIARHQLHRSLFHNLFVIGILYLANPFLSLGALTHSILDMFTSATDRGVELLFPLTRVTRNYHYTIQGQQNPHPRRVEWWVEDPWRLLQQTSDRDLREPQQQPWRRSYGPFKNSRISDWGIFFSAIVFLAVAYLLFGSTYYSTTGFSWPALISLGGFAIFYGLGEWWRRKLIGRKGVQINWIVLGILVVGLVLFLIGGAYMLQPPGIPNLGLVTLILASTIVGFFVSYFFVKARKSQDLSL